MQRIFSLFLFLTILSSAARANSPSGDFQFCRFVISQLSGFPIYGSDQNLRDRERFGDVAVNSGLLYFYKVVPVKELPAILSARYFPDLSVKKSDGSHPHLFRQNLAPLFERFWQDPRSDLRKTLGGIYLINNELDADESGNVTITPRLYEGNGDHLGRPIATDEEADAQELDLTAYPNQNALLIYSPRILNLASWAFGVRDWHLVNPMTENRLTPGWGGISSSSSLDAIERAFRNYPSSGMGFRLDGMLPSYELMGIVVNPENEDNVRKSLRPMN